MTFLEPSQPIKDSTVRTILRRLEKKGYVGHRTVGRTYVYSPTINSTDPGIPLRPRIREKLEIYAGDTTTVEIPFEPTVRVRGRVQAQESRKPVSGGLVSVAYGSFRQSDQVRTDADGRFEANVLAGRVRQQLIMRPLECSGWIVENDGPRNPVNVPVGVDTFDLPPLELIETFERMGRLVR